LSIRRQRVVSAPGPDALPLFPFCTEKRRTLRNLPASGAATTGPPGGTPAKPAQTGRSSCRGRKWPSFCRVWPLSNGSGRIFAWN